MESQDEKRDGCQSRRWISGPDGQPEVNWLKRCNGCIWRTVRTAEEEIFLMSVHLQSGMTRSPRVWSTMFCSKCPRPRIEVSQKCHCSVIYSLNFTSSKISIYIAGTRPKELLVPTPCCGDSKQKTVQGTTMKHLFHLLEAVKTCHRIGPLGFGINSHPNFPILLPTSDAISNKWRQIHQKRREFLRNPPIAFRLLVGVRPSQGMTTTHHERLHPRTCPHEVLRFCDFEGIEVVGSTHLASPLRKSQDFHVEKGHLQIPEVSDGQHNSIHMGKLSPLPLKYDDYSNDYACFHMLHLLPSNVMLSLSFFCCKRCSSLWICGVLELEETLC